MVLAPHETGEMHPSTRGPVAACIRHMSAFACGYMPINYILFAICLSETDGVRTGAFYSFTVHTHTHQHRQMVISLLAIPEEIPPTRAATKGWKRSLRNW